MPFICLYRVTRYLTTIQQSSIIAWFLERSIQIISHHCVGILFITNSNYHARVIFPSNGQSQKQHTTQTSRSQLHGTLNYVYLQEYIEKAGSSSTCGTPVFLKRRVAARYRALASIIPGRESFSWNLSF